MADTKISLLSDGVTAAATDRIPVSRAGVNVYIANSYIAEYIRTLTQTMTNKTFTTPVLGVASGTSLNFGTTILQEDAAAILALRNGVTAQTSRTYNTYTDVSNGEWLSVDWSATANVASILTKANGTGVQRALSLGGSGAANWQISTSGHLLGVTDNTYDIGASGATRPRNLYVAGVGTFGNGTFATGTITTSQPITLTQTWNAGAVTFTGLFANITSTASAAASLLMDLQVGGVSQLTLNKLGVVNVGGGAGGSGRITFADTGFGIQLYGTGSGVQPLNVDAAGGLAIVGTAKTLSLSTDVILTRDAANNLALRNGTAAQNYNVYGTYTDASNYERIGLGFNGTSYLVYTAAAGTGTSRPLTIGAGSAAITIDSGSNIDLRSNAGTVYWRVSSSNGGRLEAGSDNTYDIGVSGSVRPRDYFGAGKITSAGATSGVGYAAGAGGAVTQITSRTTGVTLNTVAGAITLVSAAGSATPATLTVTDSAVAATDVIKVVQKSGADKYHLLVTNVAAGSFQITFFTTGGTTTESPVFNFAVIKAVTS